MAADLAALAALYQPGAAELAGALPEIVRGLRAQCEALAATPTVEAAERLASNLEGARRHVLKLREKLMADAVS